MLSIAMTILIVAFAHCQEIPSEEGVAGPFASLAIINAIVIDGTGEEPYGPVDLLIEENTITAIDDSPSTFRLSADSVHNASNEYVTPGFIDMHVHIGDPRFGVPAEYQYLLWLAHGVTSVRDAGCLGGRPEWWIEQRELSGQNQIVAPRIFAYKRIFDVPSTRQAIDTGFDGIKLISVQNLETIRAITSLAHKNGLFVMTHNSTPFPIDELSEVGVDTMEHWYGLPESLSEGRLPMRYSDVYRAGDEQEYFRYCGGIWKSAAHFGKSSWIRTARGLPEPAQEQ
jgi:hypothetical protein